MAGRRDLSFLLTLDMCLNRPAAICHPGPCLVKGATGSMTQVGPFSGLTEMGRTGIHPASKEQDPSMGNELYYLVQTLCCILGGKVVRSDPFKTDRSL